MTAMDCWFMTKEEYASLVRNSLQGLRCHMKPVHKNTAVPGKEEHYFVNVQILDSEFVIALNLNTKISELVVGCDGKRLMAEVICKLVGEYMTYPCTGSVMMLEDS